MTQQTENLANLLKDDSGIDRGYRHSPKCVAPGDALELSGTLLKWYAVHSDGQPVPNEITRMARAYLERIRVEARGFGFVILHRCGSDFYFLIVNTWRNNNELWETVFYKNSDAMADFALFPREGEHKPSFCVWELAPVWHETKAWERFLQSPRDQTAAQSWLCDLHAGAA